MSPQTIRGAHTEWVRELLIRHKGGICVGTFGDECLCGWRGESWEAHVAPLIVEKISAAWIVDMLEGRP